MTRYASFARFGMLTSFALALASACGGQSFTNDGGQAGKSSSGGSGQAGSGSNPTGGKGHAGSASGGSGNVGAAGAANAGTGSVGAAGSGGTPTEACGAAPQSGTCDAYIPAWYHDPSTGLCRPFVYGGCGGNANRYGSLEDCQKACSGGSPNLDACQTASDCIVTGTSCCAICDGPDITAHDLIAYNRQYANQLQCGLALDVAGTGGAAAAGAAAPIACAPCLEPPVNQGTLKYFVPDCVRGQCAVVDLRTSPVTACQTSADCKLRRGTQCCEGCGTSGELIAVRSDGSFEKLVCAGTDVCDACAPAPTDAVAFCGAENRCEVVVPL